MAVAIEKLENEIINLPQDKLKEFRAWFEQFDSKAWDKQIEHDASIGKLDDLANAAIADHQSGTSTKL